MRLTRVLYKHKYHRMFKRVWDKQGKMLVEELGIPPELQEAGVHVHDPKELIKEPNRLDSQNIDDITDLEFDIAQPKKYYLFNNKVRVTDNENQVLVLTKTLLYEGLPSVLKSLVGAEQIPNQDQLVQRSILQALVQDGQQDKLPKIIDLKKPGYNWPRVYGIRYKRKSSNLIEKLHFLSDMGSGKYAESLKRSKVVNAFSETVFEKDGDTVICQINGDILLTSEDPLKPFASPKEVYSTKKQELASIYPIKCTLDLEQSETSFIEPTNSSDDIDICSSTKTHIHTLHMVHRSFGFWFPTQKLSKAIVGCFSFAAEEARRLYGFDVKELPAPISVQCVYSDIMTFGFLAFQLNTLDLNKNGGIKNQAWVDGPYDLYETVDEQKGITNYNSEVFEKMLAFYMNGVHPISL